MLAPLGGLQKALVSGSDLMHGLGEPLVAQTAAMLGELLPVTDVAQVIHQTAGATAANGGALPASFCLDAAAPLVRTDPQIPAPASRAQKLPSPTLDFLLIPASEAGKKYGEEAKAAAPQLHLVTVPGQADLMFCREQTYLSVEDVQRVLQPCRPAYEEAAVTPPSSPHARADISDWLPLNP